MTVSVTASVDPLARKISLGDAPMTQTGSGGQWVNDWSVAGVTAVQKSDVTNDAAGWTAVKYTDLLASTLAGGDIYRGDLGVSGQSAASSSVKQEIDGKEALRFNLAEAAQSVSLHLSSFYANDDGTGYAEGARVRLFDAAGKLVGESFVTASSATGDQQVVLGSDVAFSAIEISAGAQKADGSFVFGAYANADGSFGTAAYSSAGATHGSDLLVHSISFALARPTAVADNYTLDEDAKPATFASVLANDKDANGAPLTAVLVSGASHGTVALNADGTFTYQADAHYVGEDTFSYSASNGKDLSDATLVHLTVNAVISANHAPVAARDGASTDENTPVSGNVLTGANGGRDTDPDGDSLAVTTVGTFATALGGRVTISANGDFTYDPTGSAALKALVSGASGVDGFDYAISDGHGGTATAHVDVTVHGRDGLLDSVATGTQLSYYLNVGASWVKIDGFSVDATSNGKVLANGAGTATSTWGDFHLELGNSAVSNTLAQALLNGTHLSSVGIAVYDSSAGSPQLVQQFTLGSATVTSLHASAGADGATSNAVSLAYGTFHEAVSPLNAQGKPDVASSADWQVTAGAAGAGGSATPLDLNHLVTATPTDAPLSYYVHVDGIDGWVALSNFSDGYTAAAPVTAGATGKASQADVTLDIGVSKLLTALQTDEAKGTHLASVQVEAYAAGTAAGSAPVLVDDYTFKNVLITGIDSGTAASNAVSLTYGAFTHAHLEYDGKGGVINAAADNAGYDFVAGAALTVPAAKADALAATATIPVVASGTQLSYYLNVGASWVQIDGFSVDTTASGKVLANGAGVGTNTWGDFHLELGNSAVSSTLAQTLLNGTHLSSVGIAVYDSSAGSPQLVQQFTLGSATVTSLHAGAGADGATSNAVSLAYGTFHEAVSPLNAQGTPDAASSVTWQVTAGAAGGGGSTTPLDLNHLVAATPTDAPLSYYVHVDGTDGWVALSNFSDGYTAAPATAGAAGKATQADVTLDIGVSKLLTALQMDEVEGTHLTSVQVEAYSPGTGAGAAPVLVDEYTFSQAAITGIGIGPAASNAVSLTYGAFTHAHLEYDGSGAVVNAAADSTGYDFVAGSALTAPAPVADAIAATIPVASVAPGTQLSYYLNVGGSWVQIDGFSVDTTATTQVSGGPGVGASTFGDFKLELGAGTTLSTLTQALLKGTHFDSTDIEVYDSGAGSPQLVQKFTLTNATVTSVQTGAGADGATSNAVSLAYGGFHEVVSPLNAQGVPEAVSQFNWALTPGSGTGSSSTAAADLGHLAPVTPTSTALSYFVHVDGTDGWVALNSFSDGYTAAPTATTGVAGKAAQGDVTIGIGVSNLLTALLIDDAKGVHIPTVQVEAYAAGIGAGAAPVLVDEYRFNNALVTGVASGTGASNAVSLTYGAFTHAHVAHDQSGAVDAANSSGVGYDFTTATVIGVPAPVPNLYH
jgi:VCBS repeat-containing protein